jgi:uncharacterized ferritin-like protein (DUF455 family)
MMSLSEMACNVLETHNAREKTALSRKFASKWFQQRSDLKATEIGTFNPPPVPARPVSPELLEPKNVPRRKTGSKEGRNALLHAVAHIELNAVDLHWDLIARFSNTAMPIGFYDDWVKAADDESKHFNLMCDCLESHSSFYGAMPAHGGMWRAAEDTANDFLGRLAVVPMVLEARGLDVTPGMIKVFENVKDTQAVAALNLIYSEEVAHVAYGSKWFHFLCGKENIDPKPKFHELVRKYFHSNLRPPFNDEKRAQAGIAPDFYWPLVDQTLLPPGMR